MKTERYLLEINHLAVSFSQYDRGLRKKTIYPIRDLSLKVRGGEITAVVGASGSGKSLLAHAVMGLMPYNCHVSGEILYEGSRLDEALLRGLRGQAITLVPQGVSYLDPLMKVGEQIRRGEKSGAAREKSRALLARYGLGPETEQLYPFQLSGGMARRVMIASALMEQPKLVIADEPTPGLDQRTALRVMGHFREIACSGAGVLLITHDLELAMETADRILIFHEGSVIEETVPEAFAQEATLCHPYTKALYRAMPQNGFQVRRREGAGDEAGGR